MGKRVEGVDVARGIACVAMFQAHAFDGWVVADDRSSAAYGLTRMLATLPLPTFLLLAGASMGLQLQRGGDPKRLRWSLVKRGLQVLGWGYVVNAVYMAMDGGRGMATVLRVDILHAIGLSIAAHAALCLPTRNTPETDRSAHLTRSGSLFGIGLLVSSPWVNRWTPTALDGLDAQDAQQLLRPVLALFGDVPGAGSMPLFPLGALFSLGLWCAFPIARLATRPGDDASEAARRLARSVVQLVAWGTGMILTGHELMDWTVSRWPGPLSRAHPAIWFNAIDLGGRALLVLGLGLWLGPRLRGIAGWALRLLGRHSLLVYALHLPFCYGRISRPLTRQLDMTTATAAVVALTSLCIAAAWVADGRPGVPGRGR